MRPPGPGKAGRFRGALTPRLLVSPFTAYTPPSLAGPVNRQGRPWGTTAPDRAGQEEYEDGETKNLS
jgi:hypothetical protein